jgi:hypothetical protein
MTTWPMVPGCPAAGHMTPHGWHPGGPDGCPKCPDPEPDLPPRRRVRTEPAREELDRAEARRVAEHRHDGGCTMASCGPNTAEPDPEEG